jgi:transcriptional regulator with XRE-family HTH domain
MENIFGKNIRKLRKRKKLTLVEVAKALKISKSAISDYESGKSKPGLDVVVKLSEYFYIPVDDLNNSDIPEFENVEFESKKAVKPQVSLESLDGITQWKQRNDFNVNLLRQKNESLEMQLELVKELIQSKEAENKSLQIQVKLLQEKLKG